MSLTILLVEDDENDAFFLTRALKRAGILNPIQHVCDGRQALEYFQGGGKYVDRNQYPIPGLVLLDLKLPYVTGLDVLNWFRHQDQFTSAKVLVFSASEDHDDVATAYRYGADGYLVKPGTLAQLDAVARTIRDSWLNANHQPARSPQLDGEIKASNRRPHETRPLGNTKPADPDLPTLESSTFTPNPA